jgi:hypothetical protein
MTEFESKLISQLELLNENLSTQKLPSELHPKLNLAECIVGTLNSIDSSLAMIRQQVNNVGVNIDHINNTLKEKTKVS